MPYKDPNERKKMMERQRAKKRDLVLEKKRDGCCRCGFTDPRALVFHHREPSEKFLQIGQIIALNYSMDKLVAELEKCDVMCANCHNILHAPSVSVA